MNIYIYMYVYIYIDIYMCIYSGSTPQPLSADTPHRPQVLAHVHYIYIYVTCIICMYMMYMCACVG